MTTDISGRRTKVFSERECFRAKSIRETPKSLKPDLLLWSKCHVCKYFLHPVSIHITTVSFIKQLDLTH